MAILILVAGPVNAATQVIVESYGDSTSLGLQTVNGQLVISPNNEPARLQGLLRDLISPNITVKNEGVGGTEAWQLLTGNDGKHLPWAQQMAQSPAQIVILNFLLNDQYLVDHPKPGVWQERPSDYIYFLAQLVQGARDAGKTVVLYEPNPTNSFQSSRFMEYLSCLRYVAANMGVLLVKNVDQILAQPNWQAMLSEDNIHPSDALYLMKAQFAFPVIAPLVQQYLK